MDYWLRRVIEAAFIEEGFYEGDDGALIMRGQIGRTPEPSQEPGRARSREIIKVEHITNHLIAIMIRTPLQLLGTIFLRLYPHRNVEGVRIVSHFN